MKSSKIENIFDYNPLLEESEALSPLDCCRPFRSSLDSEFVVPAARPNPLRTKRWSQGTEKPPGNPRTSGGGISGPWDSSGGGFGPLPSPLAVPSATSSTSVWGEPEARSLCNSSWLSPGPSRPSFSAYEEAERPASVAGGSGIHPHFLGKSERNDGLLELGLGGVDGSSFQTGVTPGQPTGQPVSFDGNSSRSTYYPLMLKPLGKNVSQNTYKMGHSRPMVCNFCKNNKEVPDIYLNHYLYDPETKVLSCPVLRKHVCEICGGTGDQAHTLQYCPVNRERGLQSKVPVLLKTRTITNSTGKIRRN